MARSSETAESTRPQLLSMAQLARHFSLPESTLRYYTRRFAPYFQVQGAGRRRKYSPQALEVIAYILENMPRARTATNLEQMLRQTFATEAFGTEEVHSLEDLQQRHRNDIARIEKELLSLRQLILASEQTQQEDLEQLRQWMGRYLKHKGEYAD